jgi:hypothetical protein
VAASAECLQIFKLIGFLVRIISSRHIPEFAEWRHVMDIMLTI